MDVYLRRGRPIGRYEEYNPNLGAEECTLCAMILNRSRVLETLRLHVAQDVVNETRFDVWLGMAMKRERRRVGGTWIEPKNAPTYLETFGLEELHVATSKGGEGSTQIPYKEWKSFEESKYIP
ncbi:hypothetical protein F2Q70_00022014 [Brassica cretica]|uniref:Uncharacterized protein n=2 Tax=Brassica cretica TaxID=69181 RepID=A0A3N6PWH9_BRACR|nr:hypothetical protein F2Q70_00022014 [Brassica cretica]KAF2560089.1 hypothetical protein F2Q68_00015804 [Brassica cretica]KAF3518385.1 hypothetical protein DY000_02064094 [Brassica cretica]